MRIQMKSPPKHGVSSYLSTPNMQTLFINHSPDL